MSRHPLLMGMLSLTALTLALLIVLLIFIKKFINDSVSRSIADKERYPGGRSVSITGIELKNGGMYVTGSALVDLKDGSRESRRYRVAIWPRENERFSDVREVTAERVQ